MRKRRGKSNHREADLWKEISVRLQPVGKAFKDYIKKRKIQKEKEELKLLKEEAEKNLEAERRLKEEEKRLKIEQKLKEKEERRLKEKKLKEEEEERVKQVQI